MSRVKTVISMKTVWKLVGRFRVLRVASVHWSFALLERGCLGLGRGSGTRDDVRGGLVLTTNVS